ncbi:calcium-binding protein [Synechococcus sp. MIT S9507]|uniref:calcium-binding protein n=1 Tax=Synechococcus sp. MIT S9507 TaxID=3082544 RepID=UPI0039B4758F
MLKGTATSTSGGDKAKIGTDKITSVENLIAGNYSDQLTGTNGSNTIQALSGNDWIYAAAGNDVINGGSGSDTAVFSGNNNKINLNTTNLQNTGDGKDQLISIENVNAGSGNDTVTGNKAKNTLNGQSGNDKLYGAAGNDKLIGGAVNDVLFGGSGDDIIDGGIGSDKMNGGSGNDVFVLNSGAGYAKIMDFDVEEDWILIDSDFNTMGAVDSGKDLNIFEVNDLVAKVIGLAGTNLVNNGEGYVSLDRA